MELPRKQRQSQTSATSVKAEGAGVGDGGSSASGAVTVQEPFGAGRRARRREIFLPNPKAKLLDQCREVLRFHHYSLRTEQSYVHWIRRFIFFHNKRHPKEMGRMEINAFLSHLATEGAVAASTQNQTLHALLFFWWRNGNGPGSRRQECQRYKGEGNFTRRHGATKKRWRGRSILGFVNFGALSGIQEHTRETENGQFTRTGMSAIQERARFTPTEMSAVRLSTLTPRRFAPKSGDDLEVSIHPSMNGSAQ